MALFKFVSAIFNDKPIDIYNNGDMYRDFTYVDDLVNAIKLLINKPPKKSHYNLKQDSDSTVAPFRIVNIGNSNKVNLLDFIEAIESIVGKKAIRNYMPMQMGDVPSTLADSSVLKNITDYRPETNFKDGIAHFVKWYRDYYNV
jgi:UDP-glucuronate 4-epimerase